MPNDIPAQQTSQTTPVTPVLVLYNDDINTFDDVIMALIEVCFHTCEQAEQCALTAHIKGKCEILSGSYEKLVSAKNALIQRNLTTKIE